MTQNELIVMRDLLGDVIEVSAERNRLIKELADKSDVNERQDKEYSSLCLECDQLREREADALKAISALEERLKNVLAERDEARRKLGALTLCVGFSESYVTNRPGRALRKLQAAVKKCIDENRIVLTEGGMAK